MRRRVDAIFILQEFWPFGMDQREEFLDLGPMSGKRQRRKLAKFGKIGALSFHFIHHCR